MPFGVWMLKLWKSDVRRRKLGIKKLRDSKVQSRWFREWERISRLNRYWPVLAWIIIWG